MPQAYSVTLGADRRLHAVWAGVGPDLLLIHGALVTHHDWVCGPFDALAARGRAIAVDRPGHGLSRRPRFAAEPARQAAQIREGLAGLGLERPLIVAHSFGAMVALAYAAERPEAVRGLVLLAPIAFPELRPLEHLLFARRAAPLIGPLLSEAARWSIDPGLLRLAQRQMFAPQPVPEAWEATFPYEQVLDPARLVDEGEDAAAMLPGSPAARIDFSRVTVPVAVLAGRADRIVDPKRHAERLAQALPSADLTLLDDVGHMVHHAAAPAVLAAVDRLDGRTGRP